jgi:hypothetical protein
MAVAGKSELILETAMQDQESHVQGQANGMELTLPVEIRPDTWQDVRIDAETTAGMVLETLHQFKDDKGGEGQLVFILELSYDATDRLRQMRKLEREQRLAPLAPSVLAPRGSFQRSQLTVAYNANATVVFFNDFVRMLTGVPHEHLAFYPDSLMTVAEVERRIKYQLGLPSSTWNLFALHGNYGHCVTRLEPTLAVGALRRAHDDASSPGFFQFQVLAEYCDHELLGVERASWLYIRQESRSSWHLWSGRFNKRYVTLQGTTLHVYEREDKRSAKKLVIDRVDECRVLYLGSNAVRSKYYLRMEHPSGAIYTLWSAYKSRMSKWLTALNNCHRVLECQQPVTARSLAGLAADLEDKARWSRRQSHRVALRTEPREPLERQRVLLQPLEDVMQTLKSMAKKSMRGECMAIKSSMVDSNQGTEFADTVRVLLQKLCELPRPGFAASIVPMVRGDLFDRLADIVGQERKPAEDDVVEKNVEEPSLEDNVLDECLRLQAVHRAHVMDEAPFPEDIPRDTKVWGPRMQELRDILADKPFFLQCLAERAREIELVRIQQREAEQEGKDKEETPYHEEENVDHQDILEADIEDQDLEDYGQEDILDEEEDTSGMFGKMARMFRQTRSQSQSQSASAIKIGPTSAIKNGSASQEDLGMLRDGSNPAGRPVLNLAKSPPNPLEEDFDGDDDEPLPSNARRHRLSTQFEVDGHDYDHESMIKMMQCYPPPPWMWMMYPPPPHFHKHMMQYMQTAMPPGLKRSTSYGDVDDRNITEPNNNGRSLDQDQEDDYEEHCHPRQLGGKPRRPLMMANRSVGALSQRDPEGPYHDPKAEMQRLRQQLRRPMPPPVRKS